MHKNIYSLSRQKRDVGTNKDAKAEIVHPREPSAAQHDTCM